MKITSKGNVKDLFLLQIGKSRAFYGDIIYKIGLNFVLLQTEKMLFIIKSALVDKSISTF